MVNFNYVEVFRLLKEMEQCVNRIRLLRINFEASIKNA